MGGYDEANRPKLANTADKYSSLDEALGDTAMTLNPEERRQRKLVEELLAELRALASSIHSLEVSLSEKLVRKPDSQPEDATRKHNGPKKQDHAVQPTIRSIIELPPRFIDGYESEQRKAYRLQKREVALGKIGLRIQGRISRFALYTFVAVAVYAGITALQWYQAYWATKISNRAYLGVQESKIWRGESKGVGDQLLPTGGERVVVRKKDIDHTALDNISLVEVDFVNSGNTPARKVTGWINIGTVQGEQWTEKLKADPPQYPMPIPERWIGPKTIPKDGRDEYEVAVRLTDAELDLIRKLKLDLITYGVVTYEDFFGVDRFTQFCYFYNVRGDKMQQCAFHNAMK